MHYIVDTAAAAAVGDLYTKGVANTCPFSHELLSKGKRTSLCALWRQTENGSL